MASLQEQKHLLAIGIDERVFEDGEIRKKVFEYGEGFDSVHIICRSSRPRNEERVGRVAFYPLGGFFYLFPFLALLLGYRIIRRCRGRWLISSDNPFELGLVSWVLAIFSGAKLHLHVHTDFLSIYFRRGSFKERLRYYCGRFVVPRADCIRAVSERIKRALLGSRLVEDESRVRVLPVATNIREFMQAEKSGFHQKIFASYPFRMIAVGRFVDKEKNFSMLIDMMRDFVKVCPRSLLVLVGDGPDQESHKLQITNYKLHQNVIMEGWKDNLPSFYKNFDLFLLSSNYEGWGRVVIEAMASGLPVVMTDVGLAGEVVRDGMNGIVVPVGDKDAFLRACTDLYKDQTKRHRLVQAARETVVRMVIDSHQEYAKKYGEMLAKCLQ